MGDLVIFPFDRAHRELDLAQKETIQALEDLLAEARAGRINGFAYISRGDGLDYAVGAAGTALKCPDSTQQLLILLYTELSKIARPKQ